MLQKVSTTPRYALLTSPSEADCSVYVVLELLLQPLLIFMHRFVQLCGKFHYVEELFIF
jgi:hypothetical protein